MCQFIDKINVAAALHVKTEHIHVYNKHDGQVEFSLQSKLPQCFSSLNDNSVLPPHRGFNDVVVDCS